VTENRPRYPYHLYWKTLPMS